MELRLLNSDHDRLIRKLESIAVLSDQDREAVRGLPLSVRDYPADQTIIFEGDRPHQCCLVLTGFLCRFKDLPNGGRQIMSFHIPGDVPDLQSLHLKVMDHSLGTLEPSKLAFIPHRALLDLTARYPNLTAAFWRDTLIDGAIFREWLTGVGRRSSYGRMAHLFCELYVKFKAVGIAEDHSFRLPLTQSEIGDALGLSTVHVNRSMQELRKNGLIASKGKFLSIENWEGLKQAGEFDPTYLHMDVQDVA
jgi:CRP-like cAMP-binding protein